MTKKPNILLVTADQWRGSALGAVGHPVVRTPNVDALAAEGVLFERHYAGAAPCSPARAGLYTGLYQMNHRVTRNGTPMAASLDNVARAARRACYDPTLFGYTDVSPDPRDRAPKDPDLTSYEGVLPGFTVRQLLPEHERPWISWLKARGHAIDDPARVHVPVGHAPGTVTADPPLYSKDETQTAFLAGEFIRWMGEQDGTRPWFAHLSFLRPHPPFVVPEPYNRMYAPDPHGFVRQPSREAEAAVHPYLAYEFARAKGSSFLAGMKGDCADWTAEDHGVIRAIYYGMISEVDAQLGRIFAAIRAAGAWDDTVIVVTSDHAEMMGDHWSFGKGGWFDQSYHIPLVVRVPGRKAGHGRRVAAFTEASDLFPTLLDLWDGTPRTAPDGRSLLPFLDGAAPPGWRDAAHWEFDFRDISGSTSERHFGLASRACSLAVIRDEAFKYVHFAGLPPLLYDLRNDPGELVDLSGDPGYLRVRLGYAERLLAWRAQNLDQTLAYCELTADGPVSKPFRD